MRAVKHTIVLALIALTWLAILFTATLFTELIMAPWDTAIVLPEVGTWQRTVNDFFDHGGALVVGTVLTVAGIALTRPRFLRSRHIRLKLALGNLAFVGAMWAVFMLATFINNQFLYPYPSVTYDPGYAGFHRSVLPMTAQVVIWALWLLWLRRENGANPPLAVSSAAAQA
jgi:hypothetical protein